MSTVLFDSIKAQAKVTDSVLVGFSGGKDSAVTLDLCFRYFKRVQPFFMYIVPNLSFQAHIISWYENKYQTKIICVPHFDTSTFFRYGSFCMADDTVPVISINDIYHWLRAKTGIWWIAAGERASDSIVRNAMIKHSGSIDVKRGRLYPIAYWKKKEVMQYIKYHKLKLGADSKLLNFSFKSLDGNELKMVKDNFPEDFEKIKNLYPLCEAAVRRVEHYGKEQISKL